MRAASTSFPRFHCETHRLPSAGAQKCCLFELLRSRPTNGNRVRGARGTPTWSWSPRTAVWSPRTAVWSPRTAPRNGPTTRISRSALARRACATSTLRGRLCQGHRMNRARALGVVHCEEGCGTLSKKCCQPPARPFLNEMPPTPRARATFSAIIVHQVTVPHNSLF